MAREAFKIINFKGSSRGLISRCIDIIDELAALGYTLTLRQLYYQLVSRDVIRNKQTEYKRLGSIINDARLAGLIDWDSIEDRTRYIRGVPHWEKPSEIIQSAADSYRIDKWADQDYQVEVWVEKDALVGIVEKACAPLDVKWFSCRGYGSQTAMYNAGKRLGYHMAQRKTPIIIHLGDHDPSGIHMSTDIFERLWMFVGFECEVERIALNMDQVEQYDPPPNPAKETDSRFKQYEKKYGDTCWELDALDPQVIEKLIVDKVKVYRDEERWWELVRREEEERKALATTAARWLEVQGLMETDPLLFQKFIAKERAKLKRKKK